MIFQILFSLFVLETTLYTQAELLSDCPAITPSRANASKNFAVQPFDPSSPSPLPLAVSNWTFGASISEENIISSQQYITQNGLHQFATKETINNPSDCTALLTREWVVALIKAANYTAFSYSGKPILQTPFITLNTIPTEYGQFAAEKAQRSIPISTRERATAPLDYERSVNKQSS
jgi:hypothetical protein